MKSGNTTQARSTADKAPRKPPAARADAPAADRTRKRAAPKRPAAEISAQAPSKQVRPTQEEREVTIARIAYFRAEARGFAPGHELDDWYAAEAELEAQFEVGR